MLRNRVIIFKQTENKSIMYIKGIILLFAPVVLIVLEPLIHPDDGQREKGQGQLETKRHWRHLCLPGSHRSLSTLSPRFDTSYFVLFQLICHVLEKPTL